jgi:hypothetical protein
MLNASKLHLENKAIEIVVPAGFADSGKDIVKFLRRGIEATKRAHNFTPQ